MVSPVSDFLAGMLQGSEPVQVQTFVAELSVETLHKGILDGLAWFYEPQTNTVRSDQSNMALLVPSGPLSRMISSGNPIRTARSSRNRATRAPGIETSTIWPGQNRLWSSTMLSTRNRRQSASWSLRHLRCDTVPSWQLSPFLRANLQALLGEKAIGPLVVHDQVFTLKHCVKAQVAVASVLRRQLLHAFDCSLIILG